MGGSSESREHWGWSAAPVLYQNMILQYIVYTARRGGCQGTLQEKPLLHRHASHSESKPVQTPVSRTKRLDLFTSLSPNFAIPVVHLRTHENTPVCLATPLIPPHPPG